MTPEKVQRIIEAENEVREDQLVRTAHAIIHRIVEEQKNITSCEERLAYLRKELTELEVQPLGVSQILGE